MALDISGWSMTPGSNSTIDGINIAENCPYANMNDAHRANMAAIKSEFMNLPATVSAATITNITGLSQFQQVSGNTTIDGFSTAVTGMLRDIRVLGTPLIKNSSALALQGSADRQLAIGDMLHSRSLGAGNWVVEVSPKTNVSTGGVRAVTGTTDTVLAADRGKLVTYANSSPIAVTLPQATSSFTTPFTVSLENIGAGLVTITPTTSTIDGAATLTLATNQGVVLYSDGTNYSTQRGRPDLVGGGYAEKVAGYTIISTDNGDVVNWTTAGATATLTAGATLGTGFSVILRNSAATGDVTIDPNGAETIDGTSTRLLRPGDWANIYWTGSGWKTVRGRYSSGAAAYTVSAINTFTHFMGTTPAVFGANLIADGTELGYSAGDKVDIGSSNINGASARGFSSYANATSVILVLGSATVGLLNISTNTTASITAAKWTVQQWVEF